MPTKISIIVSSNPVERLDAFRKKIPDGIGYDKWELSELPEIGLSDGHIYRILMRMKWTVPQYVGNRMIQLLVNPKTLHCHQEKLKGKNAK